jgi:uncharacterized protein YuzE
MSESYLEVTFRHGRPLAAYYYLPRRSGDRSHRTQRAGSGLLVDYAKDGRPLGIEITAPTRTSLAAINKLLRELGAKPMKRAEIAPLRAA